MGDIKKKDLIAIRAFVPGDENFIYSTWLKGLYGGNDWFKAIPQNDYFRFYQNIVSDILKRQTTRVNVACLKDEPDVILGYSVYDSEKTKSILHWVWVKTVWRKIGIARDLMKDPVDIITHTTLAGRWLKPKAFFKPLIQLELKGNPWNQKNPTE